MFLVLTVRHARGIELLNMVEKTFKLRLINKESRYSAYRKQDGGILEEYSNLKKYIFFL